MSQAPDSLDGLLQVWGPIATKTKREIANNLWGHPSRPEQDVVKLDDLEFYFRYYTTQCDTFSLRQKMWAKRHRDITTISALVKQDLKREQVEEELRSRFTANQNNDINRCLDDSIDLTVRLLLMIRVGKPDGNFATSKALSWEHGSSLREFTTTTLRPRHSLQKELVKLGKLFIAKNLKRTAGMKISWTDNFADHLRMVDEDSEIAIFHHVRFLEISQDCNLYPPGLIDETKRTLALLFPSNPETSAWFEKKNEKNVDPKILRCGRLRAEERQIDEFHFWRDRLVILKQIFDEKEPSSWPQWWYDRRRGLHRYPFLLAAIALLLTIVVGLIQCVEGAIQVYKALYPS